MDNAAFAGVVMGQAVPLICQFGAAAVGGCGNGGFALAALDDFDGDIISWAEMYDTASMEAKKMIVNCLIKRVDVYRDYKLHIDFNIDFEQFCGGLDIVTIAA